MFHHLMVCGSALAAAALVKDTSAKIETNCKLKSINITYMLSTPPLKIFATMRYK
jgi:hypothetical protein